MKIQQTNSYRNQYLINMEENSTVRKANREKLNLPFYNNQAGDISISKEGLAALKEVQSIKSKLDSYNNQMKETLISEEELTALKEAMERLGVVLEDPSMEENLLPVKTNEIAMDHYFAMSTIGYSVLKDTENYDNEDVAKAIMEAYEIRYTQIIKEHEEGTRQIPENLGGIKSLTLEEDLAELDKAFQRRLMDMEAFIYIRQMNKEFAKKVKPEVYNSLNEENTNTTQDYNFIDKEYIDTAISMMKQAREEFLALFKTGNYKQGTAREILSGIMNSNTDFVLKTQTLNRDYFNYVSSKP